MPQVPQDQLEPVLRVAGQLRIRGLDSDYSRESSMEPERWVGQGVRQLIMVALVMAVVLSLFSVLMIFLNRVEEYLGVGKAS